MHLKAALLAAAFALGACAGAEDAASNTPGEDRDCFRTASVNGYETIDDHNIRVRINSRQTYTLHTSWNANDLDWTTAIALSSESGWICTGNTRGAVEVTGGRPPRAFPIDSVTRDPEPPADQQGS